MALKMYLNNYNKLTPDEPRPSCCGNPTSPRRSKFPVYMYWSIAPALSGYIVDVLVVQRAFLRDQPELASRVVQAYLRAAYQHQQQGMANSSVMMPNGSARH